MPRQLIGVSIETKDQNPYGGPCQFQSVFHKFLVLWCVVCRGRGGVDVVGLKLPQPPHF